MRNLSFWKTISLECVLTAAAAIGSDDQTSVSSSSRPSPRGRCRDGRLCRSQLLTRIGDTATFNQAEPTGCDMHHAGPRMTPSRSHVRFATK